MEVASELEKMLAEFDLNEEKKEQKTLKEGKENKEEDSLLLKRMPSSLSSSSQELAAININSDEADSSGKSKKKEIKYHQNITPSSFLSNIGLNLWKKL